MPSKLPSYTGPVEEQQAAAERAALQSLQEYLAERGVELPEGIQASVHVRKNSSSPGAIDIYYFDQHHTRYRSKLQVARALGVADSKDRDEGASQPGRPRSPTVMGGAYSNPIAADAAAQQPPTNLQVPTNALQDQGFVGASSEEEAKVMATLSKYIAKLGGQLEPGWRCQVRKRAGPGNRVDTYFSSPAGDKFRSKTDVARHLGLAVAAAARRPAPASPGVDVNMAEEDVAAMLMALPHGTPLTARETARARKVSGVDGEGGSSGGWAGQARGPGTPDGGAAADRPSGLDSIAAALDEASPFQVNGRKAAVKRSEEEQAYYDSDEEETDTRADEVAELAARQMRRLRAAAAAEGLALGNGWRVDVRIRQNGTSRGSTDYYYRLQGAGSFRSVTAAVKHLLLAEGRGPPPSAAAASAVPMAAAATPANGWQLPQQPERRTSSPPRPASPEPAAPGSPGKPPASGSAPRATPASPKQPDPVSPPGAGSGAKAVPRKSNSGGASVTVLPLLPPSDSVSKGKRAAAAATAPASSTAASVATQPARTKAALAALGRDSPMPPDAPDVGTSNGSGKSGMKAGRGTAATESNEPGASEGVTDGTVSAGDEDDASGEPDAAQNNSGARKRRRKPVMTAPAPKEEPAAKAAGPRSPRRRRAASRSRMDYATMHAMADLQYALNKEDRKAALRKRGRSKASTPTAGTTGDDSKSGALGAEESGEQAKGSGGGEEGEKKESKAPRKRRERIVTPYTKLVNRVRGLISRIRVEEAYLDAYEGEGWRGANREKLRPTAELEQARLQIEKCKLGMREAVKECEESNGDRAIAPEHIDENGEIDEKEIFCGRCHDPESYEDNDIILCDGNCRRAYHEKCVLPPLDASTLPEDEGWLCPACDAKADILTMINEEYGFEYEQETPWHEVFAEAPTSPRAAADGAAAAPVTFKTLADFLAHADLPESDADDSSYKDESASEGEEDDAQGGGSAEEGSGADSEADSDMSESSSLESMASEEREGLQAEQSEGEGRSRRKRRLRSSPGEGPPAGKRRKRGADEDADVAPDVDADEGEEEGLVLTGKRARTVVDYRKLNMEMFGDFESYEGEGHSDDDFTPRKADAEAAAMSP